VTLHDLKKLQKDIAQQVGGLKEVHRRKRHCIEEPTQTMKKVALPVSTVKVATKKFFAPLRTNNMDTDAPDTESTATEKAVEEILGRLPPIVLTYASNLIQLQKQDMFEFHSIKNGTRVVTKNMVDYQSAKTYPIPKSEKLIKVVIHHLPVNTPAEDIAEGLVDLGFDIIGIKQMSTARRSSEGTTHIALPLFLVTLPETTSPKTC
jgi:hypothetical protein